MNDAESIIRKVKVLQGRAKDEAEKQGLAPDDLVIVTTSIIDGFPEYHIEKVVGGPVSYLLSQVEEQVSVFDKVQPYVSSEDGELFDLSFNTDDVSYLIIELTHNEIAELTSSIEAQVRLLEEAYRSSTGSAN